MGAAPNLAMPDYDGVDGVELRHLCDISIEIEAQMIPSPGANRINFALLSGRAEGESLSGSFHRNGGDWLTLGSDRIGRVDVRATLETDEGDLIYFTNTGRLRLDEEVAERLAAGELIRHDDLYARSAPLFETGSEQYAWLNGIVTIAVNQIAIDHVDYRIFEVL